MSRPWTRTAKAPGCSGWETARPQGRPGSGSPAVWMSPPPLTQCRREPASRRIPEARSTAQPLTTPEGSSTPPARTLNRPSLSRSAAAPSSSTSATSGSQSASVSSPRPSLLIWLSER